jgi:hypothetical protein
MAERERKKAKGSFADFDPFGAPTAPRSEAADSEPGTQADEQPPADGPPAETAPDPVKAAAPALPDESLSLAPLSLAALDRVMPRPHAPRSTRGELLAEDVDELERCEKYLRHADLAFWVRGRIMATINTGELYTGMYKTFADYARLEWNLGPRRVYQLMETWELAEHLVKTLTVDDAEPRINEEQVRQLLPYATWHGNDAAALVYELVARGGRRVTGTLIASVVAILPEDHFDLAEVTSLVEAHFAEGAPVVVASEKTSSPDVTQSVHTAVARIIKLARDRDSASRIADELEATAKQLRDRYS